jgi:outer membrane protein TolC
VLKQIRRGEINAEAITAFADLADIAQDYYATGRAQQQDVLQAAVERARAEDREARIAQEEDRARARLAAWIGTAAWDEFAREWPAMEPLPTPDHIVEALPGHPRILALQRQVSAAETGVELTRQRYKPEFGLDLVYGGRGGQNPDGSARADLFSVMVVMDLPLFHKNRQDRYTAASVAETSAALFERDDMLRRMRSEVELHAATLQRQQERVRVFEDALLPDAAFNADAAFEAYQAALDNVTTVVRARITEFELQLDFVELQAELLKTRARLQYLEGEAG